MESLANYGSEDEQDSDSGIKTTEASTHLEKGHEKKPLDDTNYDTVVMDLSEDSSHTNDNDRQSNTSEPQKEKFKRSRQNYTVDSERRESENYKIDDKARSKTKERYRDHKEDRRDRDRDRDRDRRRDYRIRRDHRRDRDDYRDNRDKEYRNKAERNYGSESSTYRERSRRSISPRDRRERKRYESRSQSRERISSVKTAENLSIGRGELKQVARSSPPTSTVSKDNKVTMESKSNTPVTLPSYYNPNVINPNKYAEQVQKRKLLWSNKKPEDTASKWGNAKFAQDTDGKVASKFMRLMGIKSVPKAEESEVSVGSSSSTSESIKKREEMFSSMEQQYEVARQVTHTMRGVGLGFSSQSRQF